MRLRFVGSGHLVAYQGGGVDHWPAGEVREVDADTGAYLLGRGDFVSADPVPAPIVEVEPPAPVPAPEKPKRRAKG